MQSCRFKNRQENKIAAVHSARFGPSTEVGLQEWRSCIREHVGLLIGLIPAHESVWTEKSDQLNLFTSEGGNPQTQAAMVRPNHGGFFCALTESDGSLSEGVAVRTTIGLSDGLLAFTTISTLGLMFNLFLLSAGPISCDERKRQSNHSRREFKILAESSETSNHD